VHESLRVEVPEGPQQRIQDLPQFLRLERPDGNHLRQIFFGALDDGISEARFINLARSKLEDREQAGMRQPSREFPPQHPGLDPTQIGRHQLDDGLPGCFRAGFDGEYGAVGGAANVLIQVEFSIDNSTFPLLPFH